MAWRLRWTSGIACHTWAPLLLAASLAGGCTTTTYHPRGTTLPEGARGNAALPIPTAPNVRTHAPVTAAAFVGSDGEARVAWHDRAAAPLADDAFTEVRVERVDRLRGALEGAAVGAGLTAALVLPGLLSDEAASNEDPLPTGVVALALGLYVGIPLTAVTTAIGAARGHRFVDVYPGAAPRVVVTPTPDGVAAAASWRF